MVGEEVAAAMAMAKDYNKVVVVEDEMGEGMQCSDHPYRTNPGGICAFCLQDKLGKLLTSSSSSLSSTSSSFFPTAVAPSSDGSSPAPAASNSTSVTATNGSQFYQHHRPTLPRGPRMPSFGFTTPKKKKKEAVDHSSRRRRHPPPVSVAVGLERSKSTATPHRGNGGGVFSGQSRKSGGGFWSFLYHSIPTSAARKVNHQPREKPGSLVLGSDLPRRAESTGESESPNASSSSSFGRKVSRSRSVGCGSRSFSGDFFERISTGFGDCTLRRVESQRDPKPRAASAVPERVRCGGIFSGFILTSASSYLVSTATAPGREEVNGRSIAVSQTAPMTPASSSSSMAQGRYRSWGWALASPMRAFGGGWPSSNSKEGRRDTVVNGNGNGNGSDNGLSTNTNTTTNNATATTPTIACHSVSIGRAETMD